MNELFKIDCNDMEFIIEKKYLVNCNTINNILKNNLFEENKTNIINISLIQSDILEYILSFLINKYNGTLETFNVPDELLGELLLASNFLGC